MELILSLRYTVQEKCRVSECVAGGTLLSVCIQLIGSHPMDHRDAISSVQNERYIHVLALHLYNEATEMRLMDRPLPRAYLLGPSILTCISTQSSSQSVQAKVMAITFTTDKHFWLVAL